MATQFMQQLAVGEHAVALEQQILEEEKARHSSVEAEAEFIRAQKQEENAQAEKHIKKQRLREKEMNLALQGVSAATSILGNVSTTSALMLGFCGEVLTQVNTSHIDMKLVKYGMWFTAVLTMSLLIQSIFMSTICVSNGISLSYYGNNGLYSVKRALHGMMHVRERVSSNFMAGFVGYSAVGLFVIWIKLDQDAPESLVITDVWVGFGCTMVWLVALQRMWKAQHETMQLFHFLPKMDEKDYPPLADESSRFFSLNTLGAGNISRDYASFEHPGYQQSRSSYNALRQDFAIAKAKSERVLGSRHPKLDLMAKNLERQAQIHGLSPNHRPNSSPRMGSMSTSLGTETEKLPLLRRKQ